MLDLVTGQPLEMRYLFGVPLQRARCGGNCICSCALLFHVICMSTISDVLYFKYILFADAQGVEPARPYTDLFLPGKRGADGGGSESHE